MDPRFDVEAIAAYDVAGVPAPANLAIGQPVPWRWQPASVKMENGWEPL